MFMLVLVFGVGVDVDLVVNLGVDVNGVGRYCAVAFFVEKGLMSPFLWLIWLLHRPPPRPAKKIINYPNRLEHSFKGSLVSNVKQLEVLVLDEADRLLVENRGFRQSITSILQYLPKQRRVGLFSATQTKEAEALVRAGMRNPVKISVKVERKSAKGVMQSTPASLRIQYTLCDATEKLGQLVAFLAKTRSESDNCKFIVYFCTCACVDYFYKILSTCCPELRDCVMLHLHGKIPHKTRTMTYEKFKAATSAVLVCTDVAARGLDIPNVDWVIQVDPPQDPDAFVHRCGRTARLGKQGNALVFLQPKEDAYVEFLKLRKVPVTEVLPLTDTPDVLATVRKRAAKDRELYDKGKLAFVSFIRSYKEHKCSYIFQFKDLNLGRLAMAFGLLHLPSMPELRSPKYVQDFVASDIDPQSIGYKDKAREKQRQIKLRKEQLAPPKVRQPKSTTNLPWSVQVEQKARKQKRKLRKMFKAQEKRKTAAEDEEWDADELAAEARLTKKLRRGKITEEEFDAAMKKFTPAGLDVDGDASMTGTASGGDTH
eukprot:m.283938 g.283938  ORF g.283938 m.283938 type:complete len:541 (+) comp19421_c0_seq11:2085-3707(+)